MSLSKLTFLAHLKTLTKPFYHHHHHSLHRSLPFLSLRCLSYATPEEAAAARRERKRRLRIEPPLNALRNNQQQPPQRRPLNPIQNPNPNAPKLPEHVSVLTGKRLELHNKILILIRENDLEEAALLTRHSIYSNCKPTIFTCNAVMAAQLRQGKYSDLLSLHRFITQAGVAANIVTYNQLINAYCDCRKTDTALEHYNQLIKNAPFNPSPTTYRILVKGLVDNSKVEKAIEIKDDMLAKGLAADPIVYNYVMLGLVKEGDGDRALAVYEELKEKLGGFVSDGVVYGNLMKAYFLKGMEEAAMECYADAVGGNTSIRMGAVAYNFVLQALIKNGKFDEALKLFDRIMGEHNPPMKIKVNLGSFNVMADGFCELGRFKEAVEVFRKMGEKRCSADTVSYNNLIEQLCKNGMVSEAEELQREMGEGNKPDEFTYILLVDACFEQDRADDAAGYFAKMVEADLKPNLNSYNKVVDGLIKAGKVVKANEIFSQMIERLKLEAANYEVMVRALCEASKLDELLELVGKMVRDEKVGLSSEMDEVVRDALRKEGREEDLTRVFEEKEREDREKAEALAAEERKAAAKAAEKAAALASFSFSSLIPKKAEPSQASGEANSVNGNTPTGIQAGTGEATSANASPAVDVVEEAIEVNAEAASADASPAAVVVEEAIEVNAEAASADASPAADVVEEALEVNDLNKESKTSNESVAEQITV